MGWAIQYFTRDHDDSDGFVKLLLLIILFAWHKYNSISNFTLLSVPVIARPLAFDPDALEVALRQTDPRVRIVKERHLRRVLRAEIEDGLAVPFNMELPLVLPRERIIALDVFPDTILHGIEPELLLMVDADDRMMHRSPDAELLRYYWGLLFREAVQSALNESEVVEHWRALPELVRNEAEFVLRAEHLVPWNANDAEYATAFTAELEYLARFMPSAIPHFLPTIQNLKDLRTHLTQGLNIAELLQRTQPKDAALPGSSANADAPPPEPVVLIATDAREERWVERAKYAEKLGNSVRSALLQQQAADHGTTAQHVRRKQARQAIQALVQRLAPVLNWDATQSERWTNALLPVLVPASKAVWPAGAKALYTLQKIAIDLENEIYAVDPGDWVSSFFRRPLVRKLDLARIVIRMKHLKVAQRNLVLTPLEDRARANIIVLLAEEIARANTELRDRIGPVLTRIFDDIGMVPEHPAEHVARDKLIAELLDQICDHGFLRFADLRDAIARNRIKLPDLRGPIELVRGDPILKADAKLNAELDGVYRRGEIYLRWIQRGSSLAFGTNIGRAITKYALLPFTAAIMTVEFSKYLVKEISYIAQFASRLVTYRDDSDGNAIAETVAEATTKPVHAAHSNPFSTESLIAVGVLSIFFLAIFHSPAFRAIVIQSFKMLGRALRCIVWDWPIALWHSGPIRFLRNNSITRFLFRHFTAALFVGLSVGFLSLVFGASTTRVFSISAGTFAIVALASYTRWGQHAQDDIEEFLSDTRRSILTDLLPGLWSWIIWIFRELLGAIDRMLYAVDEWFRFRAGQSKPSLVLKVLLGIVWFPIAYLVRFVFFLLVEPQVNPVKHFPVVTVSHKLLLTQILPVSGPVAVALNIGNESAAGLVTFVFACIPGIFGFIVWELKENWRLYAANRPECITPVSLGHHGETMHGLLHPGFHSGTIPKLFRKLRSLIQKAQHAGQPAKIAKPIEELHHVKHAIHAFVEREFIAALKRDPHWADIALNLNAVELGVQSVEVEITSGDAEPARIVLLHHDGHVRGEVIEPGFSSKLPQELRESWEVALAGLFAMCAAELNEPERERIEWNTWTQFWKLRTGEI